MKRLNVRMERIVWVLLVVSLLLYGSDYLIFGRGGEIGFGFLGNLAFLPIYVLFVTLMIEQILKERERSALRQKLNMVIGIFFSEVGTDLIRDCLHYVVDGEGLAARLKITAHWAEKDFRETSAFLAAHEVETDSRKGDLEALKSFLYEKKMFLLGLLENPNLLEHDEFTDLLWAVFHLLQELEARPGFSALPEPDRDHLSGDIRRVCNRLLREWIVYMRHLKHDYPYLFSLAVRTNPVNPEARVVISPAS